MRVRLTPVALEDVAAIHQTLAAHSEELAASVEDAVFDCLDILGEFPQFGRKTDECGVHRWPMGEFRYTIFYRPQWQAEALEVLRIIDSKRVRDLNRVPW
jgi:plasmid stabilization system protein ParE